VVSGLELVVGYLAAWAVRKARRVGRHADAEVDRALDAGLRRLHELVAGQIGADPALLKLETEAAAGVQSPRTRERVRLAVEDAAAENDGFATALSAVLRELEAAGGRSAAAADQGVAVGGNVDIRADHGAVAAWQMRDVRVGEERPDPRSPGRLRG
jgi:hypothetical protein